VPYERRSAKVGPKRIVGVSISRAAVRRSGGGAFWADRVMVGFITERELERAEEAFPGIVQFLESLSEKPRTFLELVALFEHWREPAEVRRRAA
jgi:hypothetical protein